LAIDGQPWRTTFGEMVTDGVFSPDGKRLAAVGKQEGRWAVIVDDVPWENTYDNVWGPVFSPDSRIVAAKVEKNGNATIVVNGKPLNRQCEAVWDPVFSPDSTKVLVRSIEGGKFVRSVLPITDITD